MRPLRISQDCFLYSDLSVVILIGFRTDSQGSHTLSSLYVPNQPSLIGTQVITRIGLGPTQNGPIGVDFSNALHLTLGR
jgi:hypothetical protein